MADIKISELEPTTDLEGLYTLGSDKNNLSKKVSLQFLKTAADYANTQGDYAKGVADGIAGLLGIEEYSQFSESVEYPALTVVMYNGQLYRFTQTHYAGAWLGTDVEKTSVKGVIRSVGLGNRTNEDVTTTMALRKRVDYDRYVGSLKIKVGDQEYSGTILNISADSYNEIDGYPELKVRFFVGTTLYEALNEGSTAWQISKVTDVAEWEQKLAQLDQELKALKARVAALEGNVEPEDPSEPDIPVETRYTINASADNGSVVASVNGVVVDLPYNALANEDVVLEVIANEDFKFTAWDDGNTDNPRTIVMAQDVNLVAMCENAIVIPSEYALLPSIASQGSGAYLNSGEPIDSHSNYDLYFGTTGKQGTNLAFFGVRRSSGAGDTMANAFYFNAMSTWSPYAWVCGGTDTSNIPASGFGVRFHGNMHKLSQRGNDLYEWDRQIYHLEKDFVNSDNVPAFIGAIAKNATTTYNTNTEPIIFYRFVAMDNEGSIYKDIRPAKRISDGKLGGYDVIAQEFIPVSGTWNEGVTTVEDVARITIANQILKGTPCPSTSLQSANYYKGYWISVHDYQQEFAVVKGDLTNTGTLQYPTQQLLTCSEYNMNWHGNASWLSDKKWDESDFFPLLYVSTDKGNQLLTVYRIKGSNPDALEGIELVQKITTPRENPWYFNNYYGMAGVNTIVHTGYTQNSWSSADEGNTIMARVLPLPDVKIGDVIINESDALTADFDLGFNVATGDGYWTGKYLSITYSAPSFNDGVLEFYELDDKGVRLLETITGLHTGTNDNFLGLPEAEGIKYCPFIENWTFCLEPNTGRTNLIEYKRWKDEYTDIKGW